LSRAGLFLKWKRRRHLFQQLQDLLRGLGQTKLLTEKESTIKTGLSIEGMLILIPGHLLWGASECKGALPIRDRHKLVMASKLKKEV
jgi:hypothetical protein